MFPFCFSVDLKIYCGLQGRQDQELVQSEGEENGDVRNQTSSVTSSVPDRGATVCLSTQTSTLNTSITENDEVLLTDEVFESTSPSQRLLNLTDSVRRLAGGFQSTSVQPDDEWVSTSSESGTPVFFVFFLLPFPFTVYSILSYVVI